MRQTVLYWLWTTTLAAAQLESSSHSIVTLTGNDRRLTAGEEAPTISVPSDFDGSSIPTGTMSGISEMTGAPNSTMSASASKEPLTELEGSGPPTTIAGNMTASSTAPARPSNTQPCNNYPEFCTRKYSNITEVCAHNSPFVRKNNAGSNQEWPVTQQLNDGVRMLQGQAHYVNGTLYYCHTSCDLLNAGTVEDYLREVAAWVQTHPFDVVTIIFGNSDYEEKDDNGNPLVTSSDFVDPIEKAGLMPYIYQPPKTAMSLEDWPTLGEIIIGGKRVITFIDYNFDTDAVPWMLWEFYNIWETPFSPTATDFPCTLGRPEGISDEKKREMMYIANHNLNVEVGIAGSSLLIPNTVQLNQTNGLEGEGSLGLMANRCTDMWDRPPNFLLVDYYNAGPFNGSVFEVAARANNVTYNRECCGTESLAPMLDRRTSAYLALMIAMTAGLML